MSLSAFIRASMDPILVDWEMFAKTRLPAAKVLDSSALRDSAAELLNAVADDMDCAQSAQRQGDKSRGWDPNNSPPLTSLAHRHAATRLDQGFTLEQMASEYRALRASVLRHWLAHDHAARPDVLQVIRFGESIDQSWFEGMAWFSAEIDRARELFLGVLSHDMRTPVGTVVMSAELLLQDQGLASGAEQIALRLLNSGHRMTRMIEDLLDFARVRLGTRLPTDVSRLDLDPVLRQTTGELAALHPACNLQYRCEGDLWGIWDAGRIAQMLSNLVGNAIQHGEAGRPVSVSAAGAADEVVLTVHNHGPPIAPEMIGRIFDPLMRGVVREAERRSRQESLGLGLYISQHIAKAHGGGIDVESSLEGGTTFTVRLPKRPASQAPTASSAE
jgi:signal transduction histidine kinase